MIFFFLLLKNICLGNSILLETNQADRGVQLDEQWACSACPWGLGSEDTTTLAGHSAQKPLHIVTRAPACAVAFHNRVGEGNTSCFYNGRDWFMKQHTWLLELERLRFDGQAYEGTPHLVIPDVTTCNKGPYSQGCKAPMLNLKTMRVEKSKQLWIKFIKYVKYRDWEN